MGGGMIKSVGIQLWYLGIFVVYELYESTVEFHNFTKNRDFESKNLITNLLYVLYLSLPILRNRHFY